jgi:acetyl esterase/lipase
MKENLKAFLICTGMLICPTAVQAEVNQKTYTYKKIGDIELKADVYSPAVAAPKLPVVIYIHGGGLIFGSRENQPAAPLRKALLDAGYVIVAIDYRLAPDALADEIAIDVEDACKWVRNKGPQLFCIEPNNIIVMGGSAGGYLTLLMGCRLNPAPKALVSFSGYGDIRWLKQPKITSMSESIPPYNGKPGWDFYVYCRDYGVWINKVTGLDPAKDINNIRQLCPIENIHKGYPRTLLVHSLADTDVPYEQAVLMKSELDSNGISNEMLTLSDGHSSEMINNHSDEIIKKVLEFLRKEQ